MSVNLSGFVKSLLPSFSKYDIETDMETSLSYIPMIQESYLSFGSVVAGAGVNSKEAKKLVESIYKELNKSSLKVKLRKNGHIAEDTVLLFGNVKLNGEKVLKTLSESVNDVIMSQALKIWHANLLRAVPHYYFMTKYATDLLNYIYVVEAQAAGLDADRDYLVGKHTVKFLESNAAIYANLLACYGEKPEAFDKELEAVSKITLPKDDVDDVLYQHQSEKLDITSSLPNGFIGSPIYSVRLVFAQWEADRYRSLRDKKKLIELRYLHYKMLKEQGNSDATAEKEIIHLQQRLAELDYKIGKIEEDM